MAPDHQITMRHQIVHWAAALIGAVFLLLHVLQVHHAEYATRPLYAQIHWNYLIIIFALTIFGIRLIVSAFTEILAKRSLVPLLLLIPIFLITAVAPTVTCFPMGCHGYWRYLEGAYAGFAVASTIIALPYMVIHSYRNRAKQSQLG